MKDHIDHIIYLGLGSNLGNRKENIQHAIALMSASGIKLISQSNYYKSVAWGFRSPNYFYNICIIAETNLEPEKLLKLVKQIETRMGRDKESDNYTDRIIDIDILFYDNLILNSSELQIPHPFISERKFVLEPLAEIAPKLRHPVELTTVKEILLTCKDEGHVERVIDE